MKEYTKILLAYERNEGNKRAAARSLGIPYSTFHKKLTEAQKYLNHVPDGLKLKGTSSLVDKDGNEKLIWIKTTADLDRQKEMMKEAIKALMDDIPREEPKYYLPMVEEDLVSQYTITDYHIGMMAWAAESGEDWNTKMAEDFLFRWFKTAIDAAPNSHTAIFAQLGDFLHFDNHFPVTPTSKHVLDADVRFGQIVQIVIRLVRRIVSALLEKHERVIIIMAEGNHDISSSIWLRALFSDKYADEPRVIVDTNETGFYFFEWGLTSLFYHHGHKKKLKDVSPVFAGLYRDIFGRTKFSYAHMGHLHHVDVKENNLMIVEQHPSLAPKDSHSAKHGYLSNRGATVITYSKRFGEVSRVTIRPEMVK